MGNRVLIEPFFVRLVILIFCRSGQIGNHLVDEILLIHGRTASWSPLDKACPPLPKSRSFPLAARDETFSTSILVTVPRAMPTLTDPRVNPSQSDSRTSINLNSIELLRHTDPRSTAVLSRRRSLGGTAISGAPATPHYGPRPSLMKFSATAQRSSSTAATPRATVEPGRRLRRGDSLLVTRSVGSIATGLDIAELMMTGLPLVYRHPAKRGRSESVMRHEQRPGDSATPGTGADRRRGRPDR